MDNLPQETPQTTQTETIVLEEMTNKYATFDDYTSSRLSISPPQSKTITAPNGTVSGTYYIVPLTYNYGSSHTKLVSPFKLEGCELESRQGIIEKPKTKGDGYDYSIFVGFKPNNPDHSKFLSTLDSLYKEVATLLHGVKVKVNLQYFNKNAPEGMLKYPVYKPWDKDTGEPSADKPPSTYLKLFKRGTPPKLWQTKFFTANGDPIDWDLLKSVVIKFIPLINVKHIYVGGGKASIQMDVESAIVTEISPMKQMALQNNTMQKLLSERPGLADTVEAQLAKLRAERQDQLLSNTQTENTQTENKDNSENTNDTIPTFAGIKPTESMISIPGIPTVGSSGVNLPTMPSMSDFTVSAPLNIPQNNPSPGVAYKLN